MERHGRGIVRQNPPKLDGRRFAATAAASLAAVFCGAGACAQDSETSPGSLFVLGDSLSDVGNAAALFDYLLDRPFHPEHAVGFCNPGEILLLDRDCTDLFFRRSRVSDGPVAVEHLAAALGLPELAPSFHVLPDRPTIGTNYAVAGAKAREDGPDGLSGQVDALQLDYGPRLPADALYVVMIGGNDAIDALQATAPSDPDGGEPALPGPGLTDPGAGEESSERILTAAIDAITENVERLIGSGARRVVVANVPNLGALPAVRETAADRGIAVEFAIEAAGAVTARFNASLAERLALIRTASPAAQIRGFDLEAALAAERAAAEDAGRNTLDACFDSESYLDSLTAERIFHEDCAPEGDGAPRFERFVFWDGIHPTGAVHEALAGVLLGAVTPESPPALTTTTRVRR